MDDYWKSSLPLCFEVNADQIDVYTEPGEFYSQLCDGVKNAKSRIVISSLYLGNGRLEHKLIEHLHEKMRSEPALKLNILLDHTRGMRGYQNSRTLLMPLKKKFPQQMSLSFYHTPNLRGLLKTVLPDKLNELLGLQHMKVYVFDDTLVLSGANLSTDYFTNRQDRCIVIRDHPQICNFFTELVNTVAEFSYEVDEHNNSNLHKNCKGDLGKDLAKFKTFGQSRLESLLKKYQRVPRAAESLDTQFYPLLQMGSFKINQDHQFVQRLLTTAPTGSKIHLSTAYFNPIGTYMHLITNSSKANYDVLSAAPKANGFFGASGVIGLIPDAYSYFEKSFLNYVGRHNQLHRIKISEYTRTGWTFHVKGLWYTAPKEKLPSMTIVGSSNYGHRSVHRDLEAQAVISTSNQRLQHKLAEECSNIYTFSVPVTKSTFLLPERIAPVWIPLFARILRNFF